MLMPKGPPRYSVEMGFHPWTGLRAGYDATQSVYPLIFAGLLT
jgi:hypothetical protein